MRERREHFGGWMLRSTLAFGGLAGAIWALAGIGENDSDRDGWILEGGRWGPQELAAAGRAMLQFRSILFAPNAPVGICHGVKQAVMQICF